MVKRALCEVNVVVAVPKTVHGAVSPHGITWDPEGCVGALSARVPLVHRVVAGDRNIPTCVVAAGRGESPSDVRGRGGQDSARAGADPARRIRTRFSGTAAAWIVVAAVPVVMVTSIPPGGSPAADQGS